MRDWTWKVSSRTCDLCKVCYSTVHERRGIFSDLNDLHLIRFDELSSGFFLEKISISPHETVFLRLPLILFFEVSVRRLFKLSNP